MSDLKGYDPEYYCREFIQQALWDLGEAAVSKMAPLIPIGFTHKLLDSILPGSSGFKVSMSSRAKGILRIIPHGNSRASRYWETQDNQSRWHGPWFPNYTDTMTGSLADWTYRVFGDMVPPFVIARAIYNRGGVPPHNYIMAGLLEIERSAPDYLQGCSVRILNAGLLGLDPDG
jgi:hypothetical protein